MPYTIFIDPQLGRVGMSETEARARGRKVRVAKMPMNYVARALEMEESRAFMKAVVDADTEQILGAAVLGIEGGELMAAIEVAMMGSFRIPPCGMASSPIHPRGIFGQPLHQLQD